jgi:hypothetical protein
MIRRFALMTVMSFPVALATLHPTRAEAQIGIVRQGATIAGTRAPLVSQANPPAVTAEEQRRREDALAGTRLPGPPLRVEPGFVRQSPVLPETGAPRAPSAQQDSSAASAQANPPASAAFRYIRTQAQNPFFANPPHSKSTPNSPSVGTAASFIFETSNFDAAYSTNGGQTFNFLTPDQFGTIDGGFAGNQTVIYDQTRDIFAWSQQYAKSGSAPSSFGGFLLIFSTTPTFFQPCFFQFHAQGFGLGAGFWLGDPDVALSSNYVYYTANLYATTNDSWQYTVIWRIPLSTVLSAVQGNCTGLTYDYIIVNASDPNSGRFTFTPVQGATSTMYWMSHNSTSSVRIYGWAESCMDQNCPTATDVSVTTWFNGPYSCPGPDALNWCANADGNRGRTGWVANGVIGFMWNSSAGGGRPFPYIRVARFNESTKALINEPDIFSGSFAWIYSAVGINNRGDIGGVAFWGGGTFYPQMASLIWDDLSSPPPPWETYLAVSSNKGATAWGNYYAARRHGSFGNTWVAAGQDLLADGTVQTFYTWFGRQRDVPPGLCIPLVDTHDFNGDCKSDILWRYSNGGVAMWLMSSNAIQLFAGLGSLDLNWQVVGTRDMNRDGFSDILWFHSSGVVAVWFMNATTITSAVAVGALPVSWSIVGTGDFNGDGTGDMLLRNTAGDVAIWFTSTNGTVLSSAAIGNVPPNWHVDGTGDFNGDGIRDILWRETTSGGIALWFMNPNGTIKSAIGLGVLPIDSWTMIATGDFDGDGVSDILWRNSAGGIAMWLMNSNGTIKSGITLGSLPVDQWTVPETGDFDADGKSDILWRHSSGALAMWLMDGGTLKSALGVGFLDNNWQIQTANAD